MIRTAKIIIEDEVNIKIDGLDASDRRELNKKFKIFQPSARYAPAYRLGRWDGCKEFFTIAGRTYFNLLMEIIPYLESKNYDFTCEDKRVPIDLKFQEIKEDFWGDKCWPKGHRFEDQPIRLRPDQVEAVNTFLKNITSIQELATGAGKTVISCTLSKICEPYGRTLVIVPNVSLVDQTFDDYNNVGLDVGVYHGKKKEWNKTHTICTWQSLAALEKKKDADAGCTLEDLLDGITMVLVDEVHQGKANVIHSLLTSKLRFCQIRWGITGTVPKDEIDFIHLKCSLGDVVGRVAASELQDMGVLSKCHVNIIQTQEIIKFSNYHQEASYLEKDPDRLSWLSDYIMTISKSGNTLILVSKIETGEILKKNLELLYKKDNQTVEVPFVYGEVSTKERKEEYDEIATNDNKIIIATYGVAAVGINIPRIFNLVMVESGKSFTRVIQSIGRGIRKAKDKDFVNIWDITSKCKYSSRHLTQRKKFYKEANYPSTITRITLDSK